MNHPVEGEAALVQDERAVRQVGQGDGGTPAQTVPRRQQRHQRLVADGLPGEGLVDRQQRHRQFDFAGQDGLLEPGTAVLQQLDTDARMAGPEFGEQRRKQDAAAQRRQTEPQGTELESLERGQFAQHMIAFGQHRHGAAVDHFAHGGELRLVSLTPEQRRAQFVLSCRTALLTVGWVAKITLAAAEKPPWRTTSTKARRLRKSMIIPI